MRHCYQWQRNVAYPERLLLPGTLNQQARCAAVALDLVYFKNACHLENLRKGRTRGIGDVSV